MKEGLGFLASWREWWEAKVMPTLSGVAAFATARGRATSAATFATTAASGAVQDAPAFLLNLAFLVDRVVDAAVQAKSGDFLGFLVGRRNLAKSILGGRIIYEPQNSSHLRDPL